MHRPSAEEFVRAVLEALKDIPPDFARQLAEVLAKKDADRSQAIRRLFEDCAGD